MNFTLKEVDIANGIGVRVSLFVSGCRLNCKNCFNKEAQIFSYGKNFTKETENYILNLLSQDFISGLSILGGDPFEPENQTDILNLVKKVKEIFGNKKTIWIWTGRVYPKDFEPNSKIYIDGVTKEILKYIDVLIDGPFVQEKFSSKLKFRGSENQRILFKKENSVNEFIEENSSLLI